MDIASNSTGGDTCDCPASSDSPLSTTSNALGILTFVVAVSFSVYAYLRDIRSSRQGMDEMLELVTARSHTMKRLSDDLIAQCERNKYGYGLADSSIKIWRINEAARMVRESTVTRDSFYTAMPDRWGLGSRTKYVLWKREMTEAMAKIDGVIEEIKEITAESRMRE